jgi:PTH1 family peptidyl-tRNA hydrolase
MSELFLIAGLGNPGKAYSKTRHNVGFEVVEALAKKYRLEFRKSLKWKAAVARGKIGEASVVLVMPLTFMNQSGEAVAPLVRYEGVELTRLLAIVDDVAIELGQLRLRTDSSSGGHNGLKSVSQQLGTNGFARLRVGVGDREEGDLTSHVLGKFLDEEEKLVPKILERAVEAIEIWLKKGLNHAMDFANRNPPNPSNGE